MIKFRAHVWKYEVRHCRYPRQWYICGLTSTTHVVCLRGRNSIKTVVLHSGNLLPLARMMIYSRRRKLIIYVRPKVYLQEQGLYGGIPGAHPFSRSSRGCDTFYNGSLYELSTLETLMDFGKLLIYVVLFHKKTCLSRIFLNCMTIVLYYYQIRMSVMFSRTCTLLLYFIDYR